MNRIRIFRLLTTVRSEWTPGKYKIFCRNKEGFSYVDDPGYTAAIFADLPIGFIGILPMPRMKSGDFYMVKRYRGAA